MDFKAIVRAYVKQFRPKTQAELAWFRNQPSLESALEHAALAIDDRGIRYSHQRKLTRTGLQEARSVLFGNSEAITLVTTFDELIGLVDMLIRPIHGLSDLYIYDTSLRIGAKLGLLPTKVYIHAGVREGAKALGLKHARSLEVSELPHELQQLEPLEIEDVLCIFKDKVQAAAIRSRS